MYHGTYIVATHWPKWGHCITCSQQNVLRAFCFSMLGILTCKMFSIYLSRSKFMFYYIE
ncbi:hypothetical protein PFLUV_G00090480 [Perca fluviatilis]|uniref:Uncharacterized protein n=1 Tax=Perca fluviatilis TaxID=8168 RepID=A0A6A5FF43_PERFL|nr:hypothetical protein PFLUV_G00090480 [Perca fluviatilis]